LVGVLTLVHSFPNSFGPEQLELTKAIADQASIAVLNARLYTESSRHARVMTALADGAATINSSLDLHEIWQRVLNQTIQAMQVETAALGLIDGPEQSLVYRAAAGQNAGSIVDRRIPAGQGLVGQVVREGHGFMLPDARADKRFTDIDRFTGIEARAVAFAPIQMQSRTIGVLVAINPVSKTFDPDTITVLTGIGGLAGTTISNAQLYERLHIAHQHYHRLFEESIDPIFITDWEGRITEPNREAVRISGYPANQLHEMSVDQLHEVNWGRVGTEFEKLRDQNQRIYESVLHTAESGKVPVEVHVRRVEFEDTDSIQWTFRDITERRELDSLRENLTSMIYHDLRSPLGNIVASLDVLNGTIGAAEPAHSMLNVAVHSTNRIQRLVDSLLDINRLESGQTILTSALAKPGEIIKNAVIDVTLTAQARHLTILTEIQNGLPQIRVDENMIQRVLINLLENAIKYSKANANIEIGARKDSGSVLFWVQDHGNGIPASEHKRIFEKFARVKTLDRNPAGFGIGLAFCRIAVQAHNGKIWVESEEGKGSRFIITLPAVDSTM